MRYLAPEQGHHGAHCAVGVPHRHILLRAGREEAGEGEGGERGGGEDEGRREGGEQAGEKEARRRREEEGRGSNGWLPTYLTVSGNVAQSAGGLLLKSSSHQHMQIQIQNEAMQT